MSQPQASVSENLAGYSLMVLPPFESASAPSFCESVPRLDEYEKLLSSIQQLRGKVYVAEGALEPSMLDFNGRHIDPFDRRSWHVLMRTPDGQVGGALRVTIHRAGCGVSDLAASSCPLFVDPEWKWRSNRILLTFLRRACDAGLHVAETGGWALEEGLRGGRKGALLALSGWAITRLAGGAKGLGIVTTRCGASRLTKYLGGSELRDELGCVPPYFDWRYGCQMEVLEFDSHRVNPIFEALVKALCEYFSGMFVGQPAETPLFVFQSNEQNTAPYIS